MAYIFEDDIDEALVWTTPFYNKENFNMSNKDSLKKIRAKNHFMVYCTYNGLRGLEETLEEAEALAAKTAANKVSVADREVIIYQSVKKVQEEIPAVKWTDLSVPVSL